MERDSDDFSDTKAIKDKPEEIALAFSNVTSSLRGLPKQKNSRERRASEIKRSLTLQEKNGNAESSGALPAFEAWTVERVDAIVSADGSCKAQISGELRVFLADPHDHFGILNSFIALLQTKAIHFVPNSQFVTEGDLGVTLNKENLMAAKGHEIVLLVYHIQALAPSAHHPLLPLNVDIAFGANPARAALNFVSRDRIKPTLVNFLKLGANFTQPGVLLSRPTPSWDQTTNEAIWDLDLNPVTPIVCQFDGASEMLLSLSFDLHLETSILEVAWPSVPFKHTAHSGVFLLTSRTL
ncbi:hypothetical protein L0F63_005804 [Massospora cicadina]|nr:hypothetical protein L0F63_005804 [Massospora cicadina]